MKRLLGTSLVIVCLGSFAMPGQVQAAAPTFRAVSAIAAAANGGADPTVTLPAHAANDVFLLTTVVRSGTATVATPAGWTQIGATTVRAGTATYQFFWMRAASAAATNPLINRTGTTGDVYARVVSYRGAITTGDPWEVKGAITTGTADPSVITGITTLTADSMVVAAVAGEDDNNASIIATGTNPAAYTELYAESTTGADGVVTFSYAARAAAGATGNVSVNWNTAIPIGFGGIVLALRPEPVGTKFYFHDATTPDIGTLPGGTTTSAIAPNVTATGASTNRDMNQTLGVAPVSPALTTLAVTTLQRNWFRRFISRPLAAQTLPTGFWTMQGVAFESNIASNMLVWGAVVKVWRPSTGAVVATLLDNPQEGATEPGTAATLMTTHTSITGIAVNEGDVLLVELWAANTQGGATARTNTIRYDGTTEGNTATPASYLQLPATLLFHRGVYQSAYRLFDNADSTNVGAALVAQDTPATLGATGAAFRVRKLLHVADINLAVSGQAFKLQFAAKGVGTCAAPTGAYADVTAATVIAYNNNPAPADGANLTANGADPTHGAHTVVNQTYEELNNFTNPAAVNAGQDGKWDFALRDNSAPASTTYCFRVVKDTGTVLDTYLVYPEITTAAAPVPPDSFNAVEVAAAAVTGRIFTKLRGTDFTLDIVAIQGGAQYVTFSEAVTIDLVTGGSAGADCGGAVVTTVAGPTDVTLASGRVTTAAINVATAYPDVRVRIRYPVGGPYTITTCSSDNFSIKPTAFSITSTDATNTGTGAGTTIKTGVNFNLTAAGGAGYTGTPSGNFASNVAGTPTAGVIGGSFVAAVGGTASGTFYYSEVGNFGLSADAVRDTAFTTASGDPAGSDCIASSTSEALSGGQYGCWIGSNAVAQTTGSSGFGRFIPDNFNVSYGTPTFATACSGFGYVGQTFIYTTVPVLTVTARNGTTNGLANVTTTNYAGSYMKFANDNTSLAKVAYDTQAERYVRFDALGGGNTPALNTSGLPAVTADPTIDTFTNGVGTFTFAAGTGFYFDRSTTAPSAPFDADIALALDVVDADGVTFAGNPASFGAATAGNGITFSDGNVGTTTDKLMRYGRLRLGSASGSSLLPLRVPVEAQYWSGTSFVTNGNDNCTALASANIGLGNIIGGVVTSVTAVTSPLQKGRGTVTLAKPTGGTGGSVDVAVNLGPVPPGTGTADACPYPPATPFTPTATAANASYLRGLWCVPAVPPGTYTKDPSTRARFGIRRGSDETIYIRENF